MQHHNVRFLLAAPSWAALPEDGRPEIAFVGRSNVGKSSLLNAVVGRRQLAHTSGKPGKTQALNFYLVDGKEPDDRASGYFLVDLPGYGYAKVSQQQRAAWQRLIGRYLTEREPLRLVFHLIDSRHEPTKLDAQLFEIMRGSDVPRVILLTKSDKLSSNQRQQRVAQLRKRLARAGIELPIVLTSAEKKQGIDEVWRWIETLA